MVLAINLNRFTIVYLCNNLCPQPDTPATHHNSNALCRNRSQPSTTSVIETPTSTPMAAITRASPTLTTKHLKHNR